MTFLDTSVLIDALCGRRESLPALRTKLADGAILAISSLVLYEWLRGPRTELQLQDQQQLFPDAAAVPFGVEEATVSAKLYSGLRPARRREMDIAIAAVALRHDAALWTLNRRDFSDIPGLRLE